MDDAKLLAQFTSAALTAILATPCHGNIYEQAVDMGQKTLTAYKRATRTSQTQTENRPLDQVHMEYLIDQGFTQAQIDSWGN